MRRGPTRLLTALMLLVGCDAGDPANPNEESFDTDRHGKIPVTAVKRTPATDLHPPILHSPEFQEPVPLPATVNTAGAEDSPFVPAGRQELYFVFIKDASEPVGIQIRDVVNGIWMSRWEGGAWLEEKAAGTFGC